MQQQKRSLNVCIYVCIHINNKCIRLHKCKRREISERGEQRFQKSSLMNTRKLVAKSTSISIDNAANNEAFIPKTFAAVGPRAMNKSYKLDWPEQVLQGEAIRAQIRARTKL
uniref:Uncharacterized protein n=1 Tax=Glossina pallidipes TaxID=7398 RepID=A0A1B0A6T6_GLOPL